MSIAVNAKLSEVLQVLGVINPSSQAASTASTGWVSAANFHRLIAVVQEGTLGASATFDAKIQQATSNAGAGAKDIAGKSITQITASNNQQCLIDVNANDLDSENGFIFVQLSITVGVAATGTSAVLLGGAPRFAPTAQPASVVQTVG